MGNFNPQTPAVRGAETRHWRSLEASLMHPLYMTHARSRPGAVTPAAAHIPLLTVQGAPGIHVALVDTQQPTIETADFYPGSDTSAVTTNFEDQGGAAVNFGDINDPQDATDYARTSVALLSTQKASLRFRGNNAGTLAGKRILRVQIKALVMNRRMGATSQTRNALNTPIQGAVVMNGVTHFGNSRTVPKADTYHLIPDLADWTVSPATHLPWTFDEVDDILDSGDADTFGLDLWGMSDDEGQRVSAVWMTVTYCTENRKGFLDQLGTLRKGWDRYPNTGSLTGAAALSANTWYWWEIAPLTCTLDDFFTLAAVVPTLEPATAATDTTKDHRRASVVLGSGPGGSGVPGEDSIAHDITQVAILLEHGGAVINDDSQPYVEADRQFIGTYLGVNTAAGQQITTDTSQPAGGYAGVIVVAGWWDRALRPNRPLVIEVRSGGGAISGGGVLEGTATLYPEFTPDGNKRDYFVAFDAGPVTLANSTQYHVHVLSDALAEKGKNAWEVPKLDTRSDLLPSGTGTTAAMIQGATQGGTTDSFFQSGAADDRYDLPVALSATPDPPTNIGVDVFAAEPTDRPTLPPRVRVRWAATALTSAFGGYRVWVRRRALPVEVPVLVGNIDKSTFSGMTATQAEANLREFWLYELGWSVLGGLYGDGWDIGVSVVNSVNRVESDIRWIALGQQTAATSESFIVSNAAPWLNSALATVTREAPSEPTSEPTVYPRVAGRKHNVVRGSGQVPGRCYKLLFASDATFPDEDILRAPRAAAVAIQQMSFLHCRGIRAIGTIFEPSTDVEEAQISGAADFLTTADEPLVSGPNMPPGFVLNGTSQYVTVPDDATLDPDSSPFAFTLLLAGIFPDTAGTFVSKGNLGTSDGYGFRRVSAGQFDFFVDGASASGTVSDTGDWDDGMYHVMVGTYDGTHLRLYRDGALVGGPTALASGAITNAVAFVVGANNGGASGFSALNPWNTVGMWRADALDATEVLAASRYCLGHANYRPPPGASLFIDARDERCYGKTAKLNDLSGNLNDATLVASPLLRGDPWPLANLGAKR